MDGDHDFYCIAPDDEEDVKEKKKEEEKNPCQITLALGNKVVLYCKKTGYRKKTFAINANHYKNKTKQQQQQLQLQLQQQQQQEQNKTTFIVSPFFVHWPTSEASVVVPAAKWSLPRRALHTVLLP